MPPKSTFPTHDAALHGTLEARLRAWRADGETYLAISLKLREMDVSVDPSTVHRWCSDLGITNPERVA